MCELQKLHT